MKTIAGILILTLLFIDGVPGAPWDFDFTFTGYTKRTTLLLTSCTTQDAKTEINKALGGSATTVSYEEPSEPATHVGCTDTDSVMGTALRFYIHINDDDTASTNTDRQRMEMKVFASSPTELKATSGQSFIYAWWFRLYSAVQVTNTFFHIFQLKAVGGNDGNPLMTFTMTTGDGFHIRLTGQDHSTTTKYPMLSMPDVLGKWIQAFVEVKYSSGSDGFVNVILKDTNGGTLYSKTIPAPMWWSDSDFVRPKWGLYRAKSNVFNPTDWENFQNVQIWRK